MSIYWSHVHVKLTAWDTIEKHAPSLDFKFLGPFTAMVYVVPGTDNSRLYAGMPEIAPHAKPSSKIDIAVVRSEMEIRDYEYSVF